MLLTVWLFDLQCCLICNGAASPGEGTAGMDIFNGHDASSACSMAGTDIVGMQVWGFVSYPRFS